MAEYLILIYEDEASWTRAGEAVQREHLADHLAFQAKYRSQILDTRPLQSTGTAQAIQPDGTVTDGPFAETKEVLGGYYKIEAADPDEALAIAKDLPRRFGGLEVRPIGMSD
jgi:hypothetical protein